LDSKVDKGGLISAFFMAAVLTIVSFSCTGPFVATLLVEASLGTSIWKPIGGMFAFGLAMGLPFIILSLFPALLKKMPKSGGWLNSVKVVFAFVMLALSMKFLLTIDLTYNLDIFTREVYLSIWIVLFTLLGLYLLGKIKFSHDSEVKHIGVFRLLLVTTVFSFVVYLIPGLFGAPLKMVSGLIPPMSAQQFVISSNESDSYVSTGNESNSYVSTGNESNSDVNISEEIVVGTQSILCDKPKYSNFLHLPNGVQGYFDYEQGLRCAKQQNKPLLLVFKGHGCSICKQMEAESWGDSRVKELMKQYVVVALYGDDKTTLPEDEWVTSAVDGKVKKTMGKRNTDFEITRFKTNQQPFYVILDTNETPIGKGIGYVSTEKFVNFLNTGISK
jgi:thiol:disulfide interchange protein DsbD